MNRRGILATIAARVAALFTGRKQKGHRVPLVVANIESNTRYERIPGIREDVRMAVP